MNKSTVPVTAGIIILALLAALAYVMYSGSYLSSQGTATTTAATSTGTGTGGNGATVTPNPANVPGKPLVTTNATVAPTDTTAVVTGTVVPNGATTAYWYEYGTTPSLGKKTANQSVGSGYTAIPTPGYITGLTKNTTYYFRLVAENSYGRVSGAQNTVTTTEGTPAPVGSVPTAKTLSVSGISRTAATISGEVNPNRAATQYWFEYGKNGTLGNTTAFTSVGSGTTAVSASASLTNLDAGTTYYYRINAQNQFGTVNGAILTFKTSGPAVSVPSVQTRSPVSVGTTTATLRGSVDANSAETTYWFEYGTNAQFLPVLSKTTSRNSAGADANPVSVLADVTGLASKTTYYVRVVAENSQGLARGGTVSFKTK